MKEQREDDCRVDRNDHAAAMLGIALMSGSQIKRLNQSVDEKLILQRVRMGKDAAAVLERQVRDCQLSDPRREMVQKTIRTDRRYCARLLRAMRLGLSFFEAHDSAWRETHQDVQAANAGGAR